MTSNPARREEAAVVRLTEAESERLDAAINIMQAANPLMSIDDCVDAIFAIGLATPAEQLEMMAYLLPAR
jgi:hypothetical protein